MALHNGQSLRMDNILDHVVAPRDEKSFRGGQGCRSCGHMGSSMDGASGHRCSARADPRQTTIVNAKNMDRTRKESKDRPLGNET